MPRPPVTPYNTGAFGSYGQPRADASQGACGVAQYPCKHWGADIVAKPGTVIAAPTNGWVLVSQAAGRTGTPPFSGYHPGVVLFAHDDSYRTWSDAGEQKPVVSMFYSLLGHVDPKNLRYDSPWKRAEGLTDTDDVKRYIGHTPTPQLARPKATFNDAMRIKEWPDWAKAQYVKEGEWLAIVPDGWGNQTPHVHWEVRTAPLGNGEAGTIDPRSWLAMSDPSTPWEAATPSKVSDRIPSKFEADSGDGLGKLIVGAGIAYLLSELLG